MLWKRKQIKNNDCILLGTTQYDKYSLRKMDGFISDSTITPSQYLMITSKQVGM